MTDSSSTWKVTCGMCKGSTNHKIQASFDLTETIQLNNTTSFPFQHQYMILQCAGCDTVSFFHVKPSADGSTNIQFPPPNKFLYQEIFLQSDDRRELPAIVAGLYEEVTTAFQTNSIILAGLGLRTLVEAICIDRKIEGANLQEKIKNLLSQGLISDTELPILDKLQLIGNVSAHKIKGMPIYILEHVLQIINHVLKSVYVLPKLNKQIKI